MHVQEITGARRLDSFFFFFLHFHPFGDPYDMFMQLFYLENLFYQSSINPRLWATIETRSETRCPSLIGVMGFPASQTRTSPSTVISMLAVNI